MVPTLGFFDTSMKFSNKYRTEENFGGKKLWLMNITAELVKRNFGEWTLLQIWQKKKLR